MEKLIQAVQDWPVLIQGALGSAIFWLFLLVGQKVAAFVTSHASDLSNKSKQRFLFDQLLRCRAAKTKIDSEGGYYASILWFRASRHVIKGLIWLTLGLIFGSVINVLGIVGYLGCFYYMFAALIIVRPFTYKEDIDQKIDELEKKLAKIKRT